MRILHVLPSINTVTGGPARSIPLQLRSLARAGHEVHLYTTLWPNRVRDVPAVHEREGVMVHTFPTTRIGVIDYLPYSFALIDAVVRTRVKFDMFHVSSLWNPLASHTMSILRRHDLPYAITCHGMLDPIVMRRHRLIKLFWATLWERENVERASLIQFSSDREATKAAMCGWRLPKTLVMPINVDVDLYSHLPTRKSVEQEFPNLRGKEVILFVGRIDWVKNLTLLIEAVALLKIRHPAILLLLVGPDSSGHREQLERLIDKRGLKEQVLFTGLLEGDRLIKVFARANVLALVSQKENFGLAAAEALCAGVPVVLSDGVDMGQDWPMPPVWRVAQDQKSIAVGLSAALNFSRDLGGPSVTARAIAYAEWGRSPIATLMDSYERIIAARQGS